MADVNKLRLFPPGKQTSLVAYPVLEADRCHGGLSHSLHLVCEPPILLPEACKAEPLAPPRPPPRHHPLVQATQLIEPQNVSEN